MSQKSPKSQPPAELRVRSVEGDGWTWCYVEPEEGVELHSNETYGTADEARDAARQAYPDLDLAADGAGDGDEDEDGDGEG